jgi:hypothetical protein
MTRNSRPVFECDEPVMRPNNILRTMKGLTTTVTLV